VRAALPARISAILFDLDGVLVDSGVIVERAWRSWATEQAIRADDVLALAHGRPAREVVRLVAPHLDAEQQVRRIVRYEARDAASLTAFPGARECVDVARRGRWAVVTSGARELAAERLAAVGLPVPEILITADDVVAGKPDPEPYERARRQLAVPAAECVVVEDAPVGILAAKRAGMTVLAVTTTHLAPSLALADLVCANLCEVTELLTAGHLRQ
jgi:mannitol-1-/sugar-/sorbitol-6-phosphatase